MVSVGDFKPLDVQRAIRDDGDLQKSEKAMLWAAVLRTDNATRKVRASLATLAKDAGYQPNAATGVFADANEPVMRYFEKVERHPRRTDLWFHPSDRLTLRVSHGESESPSEGVGLALRVSTTHAESDPSASLCSTSASTSIFTRPSAIAVTRRRWTPRPLRGRSPRSLCLSRVRHRRSR